MSKKATLILEDGTLFYGKAFGHITEEIGELCFHTAMTGYQEILTDPSYKGHIIVFSFPHIGNCGTNNDDMESNQVHASGVVMAAKPTTLPSNWRHKHTLEDFFLKNNLSGIYDVNTRVLIKHIRDHGAQAATIVYYPYHHNTVIQRIKSWKGIEQANLASQVMCLTPYVFSDTGTHHVIVLDYGVKLNILRSLAKRNCRVTVVPGNMPAEQIISMQPDGILLSNGPGDPYQTSHYTTPIICSLLKASIPMFGICLGHQLLALALGGKTKKMHLGHHGGNHPVKNLISQTVEITSQNHGFSVDKNTLPSILEKTAISLFDGSLEAMQMKKRPVFSVQFHPEASPGPNDSSIYFDMFIHAMNN